MAKNYEDQMDIFETGGLKDEGGSVDPVSGNDVPTGSTQSEVRDDIPAQLSEGEFVLPADVVRYIGLENIMKMRDMAKEGLAKMEAMGQMGNSEEATMSDESDFDAEIDAFIDSLDMDEDEGPQEFAVGGLAGTNAPTMQPSVGGFTPTGTFMPVSVNAPVQPVTAPTAPVVASPAGTGVATYENKQYIGPSGEIRNFTFVNGQPVTAIPEGFVEYDPSKNIDARGNTVNFNTTSVRQSDRDNEGTGVAGDTSFSPTVTVGKAIGEALPNTTFGTLAEQRQKQNIGMGASVGKTLLTTGLAGLAAPAALAGMARSLYGSYKNEQAMAEELGKQNPTFQAVLANTTGFGDLSSGQATDSISRGISQGLSPELATAIAGSGGLIGPEVTDIDPTTGASSTRPGGVSGIQGTVEDAVRSSYSSLAQTNPQAFSDLVEEAAFFDATGYGVMSDIPGKVSTSPSTARSSGSTTDPSVRQFDTLGMTRAEMEALGMSPAQQQAEMNQSFAVQGLNVPADLARSVVSDTPSATSTPSAADVAVSIADTEAQAREVSSGSRDLGGSDFGSRGEADAVANDGWGSDSHFDSIDAQFDSMDNGGDGDDGGGGSYCCTKMVEHELWTTSREYARMCVWHRKQPQWWIDGYDIWGKVIANTVLRNKSPFWTKVMQEFYNRHVMMQKKSIYSIIGDLTIYPGAFVCGMFAKLTGRHINAIQ